MRLEKKLARDKEEYGDWHNENELYCEGIGVIATEIIQIAGIYGGGLSLVCNNGDGLELIAPDYPLFDIVYMPDGKSIFDNETVSGCYKLASDEEFRGFGFSYSGNTIAIAVADGVSIYKRNKYLLP